MTLRFAAHLAVVFLVIKLSQSERDLPQCKQVDKAKFPACVKYGFNSTSVFLADDNYGYSDIMKNISQKLGSCSNYADFVLCSLYLPRCKEGVKKPLLPCRDVCEEFVRDCNDQMDKKGMNWLKSLCSLLQVETNTSDSGCFKPVGFKPSTKSPNLFCNETVSSQKCSKLGLKSTFVSGSVQGQFKSSLNVAINRLVKLVNSSQCQVILEKLACASYTPQCEGHKMTTLCLSECDLLRDDCPEALNAPEVSSYCAEPANGNSESGFCELKTWPSARYWYKAKTKILPSSFPAGLVAALVLVPLSAVVFIYIAIAVRRRYEQKKSGYVQQLSKYTEPQPDSDVTT